MTSAALTARLAPDEAVRLAAACELAGVGVSDWIRHVVFGSTPAVDQPREDAASAALLLRLGALIVCARDAISRAPDVDDAALLVLSDIAAAIVAVDADLRRPYVVNPMPIGGVAGKRIQPIRIVATVRERSLVIDAAERSDASISAWLGETIAAGGVPQRPMPRTTDAGRKAIADAVRTAKAWTTGPSSASPAADIIRDGAGMAERIRGAVRTNGGTP